MEIKVDNALVKFEEVREGEVFVWQDKLYMKTEKVFGAASDSHRIFNCVKLEDGGLDNFSKYTVSIIKGFYTRTTN